MRHRDDLRRELEDHIDLEAAELEARGLGPEEARREARRVFGNVGLVAEDARAVWRTAWIEHALQDLRYAWRLARRQPAFTLGAIAIVALGIAAATTVFGAIRAVVLAPLPYERPAELVELWKANPARGVTAFSVSLPGYREWKRRNQSFTALAAQREGNVTLQAAGGPERVEVRFMSHDMLPLLGVRVLHGRGFVERDDERGAAPVVILSQAYWQRAFGGQPSAVGRTLVVDGRPHRIIGVAPPLSVLAGNAQVFLPLVPYEEEVRFGFSDLDVYGRLRPGVAVAAATAEMRRIAADLAREFPEDLHGWTVRLEPLADAVTGQRAPALLYLLLASVGLLVLIATANLSGLLLVRALARHHEMAIRTAVGGGRGRLFRQWVTESLALAAAGGIGGVALAIAAMRALRLAGIDLPRADRIGLDPWVLAFAAGVTVLAGLAAGVAPARQVWRVDVQRGLRESSRSVARGSHRSRNVLIVAQLALSIVLLAAAGVAVRALVRLTRVDLGFDPGRVLTVQVAPRTDPETFMVTLLDRLRVNPLVSAIGATSGPPMTPENTSLNVYAVGPAALPPTESVQADWRVVSEGYFDAMETPVLAGRDFAPTDDRRAPKVIIVNQTLARRLWGDANPIGRQADLGGGGGEPATVIGLVRDTRAHDPAVAPTPSYYVPIRRGVWGPMTLAIRTDADAARVVSTVRADVHALDPTLPLFGVRTMASLVRAQLEPERLATALLSGFALFALTLAAVGVYGVMAFATGQRTREVAVRLALGARRRDIVAGLVRDGVRVIVAGALAGTLLAFPGTRLVGTLLPGAAPAGWLAVVAAIVLTAVSILACWIPARRAARVDPMQVLRGQ